MIDFELEIQSKKVLLRPIELVDVTEMYALTKDPEMWKYFTADLSDQEVLFNWIDAGMEAREQGTRLAFTIIEKETGKIMGSTSIGNISVGNERVEIGWTWLGKPYQGKGFNAHVKYLLLKYCFEVCSCERVEFKTDVLNTAARKAMQKIGLVEEGVLRSHTKMTHGRRRDTIFYSLLKDEWKELKKKNKWR